MKKKGITLALLLSCTTAAAAPALPSTNSDLRALEQNKAQTPQQAELTSVQTEGNKLSGEQSFTVDFINFTTPDNIDKAACEELVADYVGQELTLSQLQQAADKVTAYLRKQGYTVATAFIPPQQIANGAVEIRVLLGNLGQVTVNNKSGLKDAVISSFIDRLHGGAAIKTNELETVLTSTTCPASEPQVCLKQEQASAAVTLRSSLLIKKPSKLFYMPITTAANTAAVTATAFRLPLTTQGVLAINLLWAEL